MIKLIRKLLVRITKKGKGNGELDEFQERIQFMKMKRSCKDSNCKAKPKYKKNLWRL